MADEGMKTPEATNDEPTVDSPAPAPDPAPEMEPETKSEAAPAAKTAEPTVAEKAKEAAANADKQEEDIVKPTSSEPGVMDKKLDEVDVDEQLQTEKTVPKKHASVGLAVGVAVIVAVVLILLGVLAYQNSDVSPDRDEQDATTELAGDQAPVTEEEVQTELDSAEAELNNLEKQLDDLGSADLTDENLNLQ